MKGLLRTISGGSNELLNSQEVTASTRGYYENMGRVIILLVAATAGVAGFAWGSVFHSVYVGVSVGVLWFFLAMGIQWAVCFSVDNLYGRSILAKLALVAGVAGLAFVLASVNSSFILMQTMDQEIGSHIERKFRTERDTLEARLKSIGVDRDTKVVNRRGMAAEQLTATGALVARELAPYKQKVGDLNGTYQRLFGEYTAEVAGRVGSGRVGDGPAAKVKKQEVDATKLLLEQAEEALVAAETRLTAAARARNTETNTTLAADLRRIEDDYATGAKLLNRDIAELDVTPRNGFIDRHAALAAIALESPFGVGMWIAFFFMLEILIILLKLIAPTSEYHVLLAARMHEKSAAAKQLLIEASARLREANRRELEAQVADHEARAAALTKLTMADQGRVAALRGADGATDTDVVNFRDALAKRRGKLAKG